MSEHTSARPSWSAGRTLGKPKAVNLSSLSLVRMGPLHLGEALPLLIEPAIEGVNLLEWVRQNRAAFDDLLWKHNAVLLRGFGTAPGQFHDFVRATSKGDLLQYRDRTTPRTQVDGNIYTSTVYPQAYSIALHNEGSYWEQWPLKLYFHCEIAPSEGGATPIADTRKVFQLIPREIRERFLERKWMLVRNFGGGVGLGWSDVFQTQDRAEVEAYCRAHDIGFEWIGENGLRTRQIRTAALRHPVCGEMTWFNHAAFFHISAYEKDLREGLLSQFGEERLPYNTYYGDGAPIEDEVIGEIRRAYQQAYVAFPWRAGDILVLDNMAVAHGRQPFQGDRKVLVAMTEPYRPHPVGA